MNNGTVPAVNTVDLEALSTRQEVPMPEGVKSISVITRAPRDTLAQLRLVELGEETVEKLKALSDPIANLQPRPVTTDTSTRDLAPAHTAPPFTVPAHEVPRQALDTLVQAMRGAIHDAGLVRALTNAYASGQFRIHW